MMRFMILAWGCVLLPGAAANAAAELRPEAVHLADNKKSQAYIRDGLITGGDSAVNEFIVRDIRRASNPGGFERIVIDLEGNRNGEPVAIDRAPYYQVAVTPDEKRLVMSIHGKPRLGFDARKVSMLMRKSPVLTGVLLLPAVEEDLWTFSVDLKDERPVEVFELSNPVRVIIDIRNKS
ncbi:MAG: hypothetical protein NDJ89_16520 [Oligoflexia bacterium]|nr:hypothetical protein [Oligoflexia bacterium]